MVTILLGQTLVFWTGVLAATFFTVDVLTCYWVHGLKLGFLKNYAAKMTALHKIAKPLSIAFVALHVSLALLAYVFNFWL